MSVGSLYSDGEGDSSLEEEDDDSDCVGSIDSNMDSDWEPYSPSIQRSDPVYFWH